AVEDVDRAGIARACNVLARDAHGQIVAGVAVEVARGQGKAELVRRRGRPGDAGAVLVPELVPGRRQPAGAAVEDVDRPGVVDAPEALERHADRQVVAAVAVEVARGHGIAEVVPALGGAQNPGAVLAPELVSRRREPPGGAIENVDRAGLAGGPQALGGDADGQIGTTVAV